MKNTNIGYYIILAASIVIVLAGIKMSAQILIPFLLSLFLSILLSPLYNWFNKKAIPSIISLFLVLSLFIIIISFMGQIISSSLIEFNLKSDIYSQKLIVYYDYIVTFASSIGVNISINEITSIANPKQIMTFSITILQSISAVLTNSFVVFLTLIFMILESKQFIHKIKLATKDNDTFEHITLILIKIKEYMILKALLSILTAVLVWLSLLYVGTDHPLLWAVIALLFNFIPNIGSIIAAIPAVLLTLIQLGYTSAIMVAIIYTVLNVLIGSILEPKVLSKGLDLSTLVVFLSLIFWGWLLGIVGMILSVPLTIMFKIILNANQNTQWIAIMLGDDQNESK